MKFLFFMSIATLFALNSFAGYSSPFKSATSLNFGAPVVTQTSDVSDKFLGQIIFDQSDSTFKGYAGAGTWTQITAVPGTIPVSSGDAERIERVTVSGNCSSDPCTSTSGSAGISVVDWNSTGIYTVNFNSGVFSGAPACSMTTIQPAHWVCNQVGANSSTAVEVGCFDTVSGTNYNTSFSVICVGPQ